LRDSEDAFIVLLPPFLFAEFGKKAEIVVVFGNGSATELKFTFTAMPVQD
jgi:hypothetical protein